jgi:ATP-dependent RNA helicase SUPV3L1/SUV3
VYRGCQRAGARPPDPVIVGSLAECRELIAVATDPSPSGAQLLALLGPTNTGKTHRAVERLLAHRSGMIGLPLRLLAREVYDKLSVRAGEQAVALVTGEEKRVPARPRYWVCTVEAMPLDRKVDFLAVDEIQLAAHPQRGHVFTDRLLHARGRLETWFLGSNSLRPMVAELVPGARIRSHTRLSTLRHRGRLKVSGLPPRTAIVAFSMARVYELADHVQARRGGAAVVLGAMSPRARNAQVALYQSGEVDYLVATDAIGMGLNLDIDHVAFAELTKFDGRRSRNLDPVELGQIAGRAGRHLNDGTFGTLAPVETLSPSMVASIEGHRFPATRRVMWRNRELDFTTLDALVASLQRPAPRPSLRLAARAADTDALRSLASEPVVRDRTQSERGVRLLWDVCQIPDYRQLVLEDHVALLGDVFRQLTSPQGQLSADWMERRIGGLDQTTGVIEDLLMRLAFIRTWTYIAHRVSWVADPDHWQARTHAIEDRVSDALHAQLVDRFVAQRRTTHSVPALRAEDRLRDGSPFAVLATLLRSSSTATPAQSWLEDLIDAPPEQIDVDESAHVQFAGRQVGRLVRGADLLRPDVALGDDLDPSRGLQRRVHRRLSAAARDLAADILAPIRSDRVGDLSGAARGLLYQLEQGLGTTSAHAAREQLRALTRDDRGRLEQLGVCLGWHVVYVRAALKPVMVARRAALATAFWGAAAVHPSPSAVSIAADAARPAEVYAAVGFPRAGCRAVRADVLERIAQALRRAGRRGAFDPGDRVRQRLSCSSEHARPVIEALGYRALEDGRFVHPRHRRRSSAA